MKVLVACEESQRVCIAFRERGHEAYSCDLRECSGGHPEWHIKQDVIPLLQGECEFSTCDGVRHIVPGHWDLIIAHPPCTYLTVTGNSWFNVEKYGSKAIERFQLRKKAAAFFLEFVNAPCKRICIENPVGVMSSWFDKPSQIVHPYYFSNGSDDSYFEKRTCLWLFGLPNLHYDLPEKRPDRVSFASGRTMPKWYADAWALPASLRAVVRSRTAPALARAMAEQWG